MANDKAGIIDNIQKLISKSDWKDAVQEMEKLFTLDPDPIIRVRIGDAFQKLKRMQDAVKEYVRAADLYALKGEIVKALAQYKLALRLDPNFIDATVKLKALHSNKAVKETRVEPAAAAPAAAPAPAPAQAAPQPQEAPPKPTSSVMPLFAGFTEEEFYDFTSRMVIQMYSPGEVIVKQGDSGKSVYLIAGGSVKVSTTLLSGERVELAVLGTGDFFGEMSYLTGKLRSATVEAADDTQVLELDEQKLSDLINHRPHVRDVLMRYYEMRTRGTREKIQESSK